MAGSTELLRYFMNELITDSATAGIALSGILVGGAVLVVTSFAPWWLRRSHDPLAESRSFAAIRWAVVIALFVLLTQQVQESGWLTGADIPMLRWAIDHRTPVWSGVAIAVTDIGSPVGVSVVAIVVGGMTMWRWRSLRPALVLLGILAVTACANTLIKAAVARLRPPIPAQLVHADGLAYPSGHAAGSAALGGALLLIFLPAMRSLVHRVVTVATCVGWVMAVAISRLYLGVHWLTDVAGGLLLGTAVVLAVAVFVHVQARPEHPISDPGKISATRQPSPRDTAPPNPRH
jgi:membrane-associated phospholipid phosphatase